MKIVKEFYDEQFEARIVKKCERLIESKIRTGGNITNSEIKEDKELGSVIFDLKYPLKLKRGFARKCYFFEKALGAFPGYELHDFFFLGDQYWTEGRILEIMRQYFERNGSLNGFSTVHNAMAQRIRKGKGFDYYIDKLIVLHNFDEERLKQHQVGYWTEEKFEQLCKKLFKETGSLTTGNWIDMGYSETPLNMFSIKETRKKLNISHRNRGLDGDYYRSRFEVIVANILFLMSIKYSKDVMFEEEVSKRSCDFVIRKHDVEYLERDLYIEIAGRTEDEYWKRLDDKVEKYKELGDCIVIDTRVFNKSLSGDDVVNRICHLLSQYIREASNLNLVYEDVFSGYKPELTFNDFKAAIEPFLNTVTFLPSVDDLRKAKQYNLIRYIEKNGGFRLVSESLGVSPASSYSKKRKSKYTMAILVDELNQTLEREELDDYPCLEKLKTLNPTLGHHIRNCTKYKQVIRMANEIV